MANKLEVPFEFLYTDCMKNKKYLYISKYDGSTSFLNMEELAEDGIDSIEEFINAGGDHFNEVSGVYRSWNGEETIIVELPAWVFLRSTIYWLYEK